jgi:hypothetical protein
MNSGGSNTKDQKKTEEVASEEKKLPTLGSLEEDDEFEDFPAEGSNFEN